MLSLSANAFFVLNNNATCFYTVPRLSYINH